MNSVVEEMTYYLATEQNENALAHYGVKRRSGRYPWGSGKNPFQHSGDLLSRVNDLKSQGLSEKDIAKEIGVTTSELRMQIRVANHERRQLEVDRAKSLRADGKSLNEIAQIMGYKNDSSIRSLLNEETATNKNRAYNTADNLKKIMEEKGMLDVGAGVERELGVSRGTLDEALFILSTEGYEVYGVGIKQATNPNQQTITPVLCKPGTEYKYPYQHIGEIQSVADYHSTDGGLTFDKLSYPASIDSSRVAIRYGDEGGLGKDGVIEIRRGVADLDLGNSHYAQVRIMVDGTHYLKGMAMYSDDMPDGADIVFNTNKESGTDKMKVLKPIKSDPDNPFGASIAANGQSWYDAPDGTKKLSAVNKIKEEGAWEDMSRNLSSQFLSKQPMDLINKQLNLTYADKQAEYDEICAITNPTLKKNMLLEFANSCDSAAVHMQAAALPRQSTQVILPMPFLKDNEVYAPNYNNGEVVSLIRYPHGGTFEIPQLTVNNKNEKARSILPPTVKDAIGINPNVAARLSGADFDGDQVVVIPTNDKVKIKSTKALKDLEGFDPKTSYSTVEKAVNGETRYYNAAGKEVKIMSEVSKQRYMGVASNLITDMTLKGADEGEIARAVKYSMVVIDAPKHKLDYKQAEKDCGIAELKTKYQAKDDGSAGGASTLLSRRKQDLRVDERQGSGRIDPDTGEVTYKTSGRTYTDKTGKEVKATTKSSLLLETKDLHTLSTGTPQEEAYADYGNKMKALANTARKEYLATKETPYSKSARQAYQPEVDSLLAKVNVAAKNAPRERRAQAIANSQIKAKIQDNPGMDKKEIKKASNIAINNARASVGASSKTKKFSLTDREWQAIQAGAVSPNQVSQIFRYANKDEIKQRATPKATNQLSTAKQNKIAMMKASGYTNAEIAQAVGCSTSTVSKYINI